MVAKKTTNAKPTSSPASLSDASDSISVELRKAREGKGLSFSDLHRETGISRTTLHDYESGKSKPGAREIRLLCDVLHIEPNVLIYGISSPFKEQSRLHALLNVNSEDVQTMRLAILLKMLGKAERDAWITIVGESLKSRVGDKLDQVLDLIQDATEVIAEDLADAINKALPVEKLDAAGREIEKRIKSRKKR